MLFNSVIFIILFLPVTLTGWYSLQRLRTPIYAKLFLFAASLLFYGYYNPAHLLILICSLSANYGCSFFFNRSLTISVRRVVFTAGLLVNLGLLFYFKYFNFFLSNCNFLFHTSWQLEEIALPLGISFFTFQQISFLIDRYRGQASHYRFLDYACFITYFPQLIAGPIVLHNEFIPQLQTNEKRRLNVDSLFDGISLFILGLGKKVLLADVLSIFVNAEYDSMTYLDAPTAWLTIICYMLQLYFDFSGYCDMARGIGKMFGFDLPENFNSPLKAVSVKDFWHRWHMTLSRFLSAYIYIPLGGNRKGKIIQCRNLMLVFFISGLWHGANWTFVVWGLLHGFAMVWETLLPKLRFRSPKLNQLTTGVFVTLTFGIFRSSSLSEAGLLFRKLFTGGFTGFLAGACNTLLIPETYAVRKLLETFLPSLQNPFYLLCMGILLTVSIALIQGKKAEIWLAEKGRSCRGLFILATLFTWALISLSQVSTFLYFNF